MKALVVFYSRSGHTQDLARRIASALDAPLEEIVDRGQRSGIVGYLRSGQEAWLRRRAAIEPVSRDPGEFDLVVIGTPVWNWSLSSPVRSYLDDNVARLPKVAFFCTMGGSGSERVFLQMKEVAHRAPVATLAIREAQLATPDQDEAVRTFTSRLRGSGA